MRLRVLKHGAAKRDVLDLFDHISLDNESAALRADARWPLPKFESDQAAAEYFDQHSVAGIWNQLPEAKPAELSAALAKKIRDRHAAMK
jgi:hypothetical protein